MNAPLNGFERAPDAFVEWLAGDVRAAYHEASHAVVAWCGGLEVEAVEIGFNGRGGPGWVSLGATRFGRQGPDLFRRDVQEAIAVASIAGAVGERLASRRKIGSRLLRGSPTDEARFEKVLFALFPRQQYTNETRRQWRRAQQLAARDILRRNWRMVRWAAYMLLQESGENSGEEMAELLADGFRTYFDSWDVESEAAV